MISSKKLKKHKKDYLVIDFLKIVAFALIAVSSIASSPTFIDCATLFQVLAAPAGIQNS